MLSNKNQAVTPAESADRVDQSKRNLALASVVSPIIASVVSRPAMGAVCVASGFTSVNPSGVKDYVVTDCGGYTPGAWKNPLINVKNLNSQGHLNADGGVLDWQKTGLKPNIPEDETAREVWIHYFGTSSSSYYPTYFSEVFTTSSRPSDFSLEDALHLKGRELDRAAAEALLNALFFGWGTATGPSKIHPLDVIGLYNYGVGGSGWQLQSGTTVVFTSAEQLRDFFYNLMHG